MSDLTDAHESWPVRASTSVYDGALVGVRRDTLEPVESGQDPFDREVVTHPGAVAVVARGDDDRVLVIHQYRHAAQRRMVELPAGLLDVAGEDPLEAARRELVEEGGVRADRWSRLLTYAPSPGVSEEVVTIFLAEDLCEEAGPGGFEARHEEASIRREWVPLPDLVGAVLDGRVTNGLAAVGALAVWAGRLPAPPTSADME